jgi:hypothetical protein
MMTFVPTTAWSRLIVPGGDDELDRLPSALAATFSCAKNSKGKNIRKNCLKIPGASIVSSVNDSAHMSSLQTLMS